MEQQERPFLYPWEWKQNAEQPPIDSKDVTKPDTQSNPMDRETAPASVPSKVEKDFWNEIRPASSRTNRVIDAARRLLAQLKKKKAGKRKISKQKKTPKAIRKIITKIKEKEQELPEAPDIFHLRLKVKKRKRKHKTKRRKRKAVPRKRHLHRRRRTHRKRHIIRHRRRAPRRVVMPIVSPRKRLSRKKPKAPAPISKPVSPQKAQAKPAAQPAKAAKAEPSKPKLKPLPPPKIGFPTSYETEIDQLHKMIEEKGQIKLDEVMKTFKITKELAEEWAMILETHGLITITYPPFGHPLLKRKTEVSAVPEGKS